VAIVQQAAWQLSCRLAVPPCRARCFESVDSLPVLPVSNQRPPANSANGRAACREHRAPMCP